VAVDPAGNVYITYAGDPRVFRLTPGGAISVVAGNGTAGYSGDGGPATSAALRGPQGLAVDALGGLYFVDGPYRVRKVSANGRISTVAGNGVQGYSGDGGPAVSAQLDYAEGVAVEANGTLYIADRINHVIRKVTPDGTISTAAGNGTGGYSGDGGPATSALLLYPSGVALDAAGDLYIADSGNAAVRKVLPDGTISTLAGNHPLSFSGDGGPANGAQLNAPFGVAVDAAGNFYVADTADNAIRKVTPNGTISTVAGTGVEGYSGDGGQATNARLNQPWAVALDAEGSIYISDSGNYRVRKVAPGGTISTVAGTGVQGSSGDGGPATNAQLSNPTGLALDAAGNLYIGDSSAVRKVAVSGGITTVATSNDPIGVAVDGAGNLYVTDYSGWTCYDAFRMTRMFCSQGDIVKVTSDGAAAVVPGTFISDSNYSGYGSGPAGVAVDALGNLYVSYAGGSQSTLRKVAADGTATTVAGVASNTGYSGDGGPATSALLSQPHGVAVDAAGDVYFADSQNNAIRLLVPQGTRAVLSVTLTHSAGALTQGQSGVTWSAVVTNAASAGPTSGLVTVSEWVPTGLTLVSMSGAGWTCSGSTCTRADALNPGSSYPPIAVTMNVATDASRLLINEASVSGGGGAVASASDIAITLLPPATPDLIFPANGAAAIVAWPVLSWNAAVAATSYDVFFGPSSPPTLVTNTAATSFAPGALNPGATYYWQVVARNGGGTAASATRSFTEAAPAVGLRFVPVTPCRVVDTRLAAGPFGGPALTVDSPRSFTIPQSGCGIPSTARAYALNVTVLPAGLLSFLTLWPAGQPRPGVSTLNSFSGTVVANAAVVPAGAGGAVSVYVTDPTQVIIDIDGYFDTSTGANSFDFYPVTPCRIADTRGTAGTFGGPAMSTNETRDFPVPLSGCGIPAAASAYSVNVTVVPPGYLGYLTTWPTGAPRPNVSTLNSWTGKVVANAALVPVGTNESISLYVTNPTNVILDIDGYFGQPGNPGALSFYPVAPCRLADTRSALGMFGGPALGADTWRSFPIPASVCNIPSNAKAYSLNVTAVPSGTLPYLTAWATGLPRPGVSTLNSWDGAVIANAAIVPAGTGGAVSVYVYSPADVILDINGYFAP
jgi:sugar lactone lactonase YvrE